MSSPQEVPLAIGRIGGFRGNRGEVTVRVASGDAARWTHLRRAILRSTGQAADTAPREIESSRAYRDRLVLKFRGVDDASRAETFRGCEVCALAEDVPQLPSDVYWVAQLVGAQVRDVGGRELGVVDDVIETGGVDLLLVRDTQGAETLVPLAREIVSAIDPAAGTIVVSIPEGLREINVPGAELA